MRTKKPTPIIRKFIPCLECGEPVQFTHNRKFHPWCGDEVRNRYHNARRSAILQKRWRIA